MWRPTAAQLPLWQAFYSDWDALTCVAAPGDRAIEVSNLAGEAAQVWAQVGTGVPTMVEVGGLPDAEAPDIDPDLLAVIEEHLDALLASELVVRSVRYDDHGGPDGESRRGVKQLADDTVIAVLATRNAAVDDAQAMVERLRAKHGLSERFIVASTVDSWQGQTNVLTVAIHPLSGASALDEFNSAFGRLAVTCTRATHGLILYSRNGIDELLDNAPARPGTPLGEPGTRQLPRQTHRRILRAFARGALDHA